MLLVVKRKHSCSVTISDIFSLFPRCVQSCFDTCCCVSRCNW